MFGDLLGNMQEQQIQLKKRLASIVVEATEGDGAVKVTVNANRELLNIVFDKTKIDWNDQDMVEELAVAAVNKAMRLASEKEAVEAEKLLQNIMPTGMGGLAGLFGK